MIVVSHTCGIWEDMKSLSEMILDISLALQDTIDDIKKEMAKLEQEESLTEGNNGRVTHVDINI